MSTGSNAFDLSSLKSLIPASYLKQGLQGNTTRENLISSLLTHKTLPETGFDDLTIEMLLNKLSGMDSNNFLNSIGVGEREGRFASELVAKRNYRFCHGIGRSGDLLEAQPKAAGSTLANKLTNLLLADLLKTLGVRSDNLEVILVPVATGMAIVLCLLTIRQIKPGAKYVLWSRIDQKSCFKSIISAGFQPVIIDTIKQGDALCTDLNALEMKIAELGVENIACIMSTTSCFAPRNCDDLEGIAKLAKKQKLHHLINNAYGMQSCYYIERIQAAKKLGRVDLFIQSTDKNLMVPVGGAIIASFNSELLSEISKMYPGRASFTPTLDVFITLLSLGKKGYYNLLSERDSNFNYLLKSLETFAFSVGEKVLISEENKISIAVTLSKLKREDLTKLGSMLFTRNITGARVVTTDENKTIKGFEFKGWGCHNNEYKMPYLTAAAAIGMKADEVDRFITKLSECYAQLNKEKC